MTDIQIQRAEFDVFNDCYKVLKEFRNIRQDTPAEPDPAWNELMIRICEIGNRHNGTELETFTRSVALATLEYIDRRSKAAESCGNASETLQYKRA